jgi:hypothetical protein
VSALLVVKFATQPADLFLVALLVHFQVQPLVFFGQVVDFVFVSRF